jgi:hypothetical protein
MKDFSDIQESILREVFFSISIEQYVADSFLKSVEPPIILLVISLPSFLNNLSPAPPSTVILLSYKRYFFWFAEQS